ncbi:Myb-like domain, Myb/SANT-like DNA-binding domain protein [Tanacetum coccineum]
MASTRASISKASKRPKINIIPPKQLFVDLTQDDTKNPSPKLQLSPPSAPNAHSEAPSTKDTSSSSEHKDAIPRPSGAARKSKSQRSSVSSSATSGSSKNRLTEFFQEQIQLDREAKKESLDRELAARLAVVELQKRNEELKILTFDTTGMNPEDAARIEALKEKARATLPTSLPLRVSSSPPTQENASMDITLTISPITPIDVQFNTSSPSSPIVGHLIPWNILEAHGDSCLVITCMKRKKKGQTVTEPKPKSQGLDTSGALPGQIKVKKAKTKNPTLVQTKKQMTKEKASLGGTETSHSVSTDQPTKPYDLERQIQLFDMGFPNSHPDESTLKSPPLLDITPLKYGAAE